MTRRSLLCLSLLAFFLTGSPPLWTVAATAPAATDPATSPVIVGTSPDYRRLFDRFDAAYETALAGTPPDNTSGKLAWGDSYLLQAYMQMYRATGDRRYLRRLATRFGAVLARRDDRLGRIDDYTSRALAGWGSSSYNRNGAKWHVFIVHTGMISLGPAEFVRTVASDPALQDEFGTSATLYRKAIEKCLRDADPYWRNGPAPDEGYYTDPALGLLPLNQSNALGCVLLEMHAVTGNPSHLDRAARLARFFKNRLRTVDGRYEWAYWPKETGNGDGTEDISHAAINVTFAVRCAKQGVVFTREEMARFARTWLEGVRRPDGSWADRVGGTGSGGKYMPGSAGRWLVLCELIDGEPRRRLYEDAARAFLSREIDFPSKALGVANLLRYR